MTDAAEARLDRVLEAATAAGLEAALITSDESIAYLTGFKPMQLERFFGVVVRPDRSAVIVPALDRGQIDGAPQRLDRISYGAESDGIPELTEALAGAKKIGVEEDHIIYARTSALERNGFEIAPAGTLVMGLRLQKDAAEIEQIRAACELVQEGLRHAFEWLTPGVVEQALNARVEAFLRERGATDAHPLILFGENAANPHGNPGPRELQKGDVVCADLSACLDGYWGDLTRCATVGPASEWATKTWQVVFDAQQAANAAAQPGASGRDVDASTAKTHRGGQRPQARACTAPATRSASRSTSPRSSSPVGTTRCERARCLRSSRACTRPASAGSGSRTTSSSAPAARTSSPTCPWS